MKNLSLLKMAEIGGLFLSLVFLCIAPHNVDAYSTNYGVQYVGQKNNANEAISFQTAAPDQHAKWEGINSYRKEPKAYSGTLNIHLSNGIQFDTRKIKGEPALPPELTVQPPKDGEYAYYLVQFNGPMRQEWREGLEKAGAEIMFYLPDYAYAVRMTEAVRANISSSKSEVAWTGLFQPAYKVSQRAVERTAKGGLVRMSLLLFSPEKLEDAVAEVEAVLGRKVWHKLETEWAPGKWNRKIFVDVRSDEINALARIKSVYWIEPMPRHEIQNMPSQHCVQHGVADSTRTLWRLGIMGEGQLVQDLDTGLRESQYYFVDNARRKSTWYWDANHRKVLGQQPAARADEIELGWAEGTMSKWGDESANSYHGTHTSGSIAGNDDGIGSLAQDGMAKNAKMIFIDGGGDSGSVFGTWDINRVGAWGWDSAYKYLGQRVYISSNSWGDSSCNGSYDESAMEADQFMWSHKDFLWFFSDGNDGSKTQPGSKAGSPGTNKNGVAVGALNVAGTVSGGANARASYSSWGRHTDGRLNPTVMAPGGTSDDIYSANGGTDNTNRGMMGTSMACPITAGACALLRQYLTEGWYPTGTKIAANGFTPSGALMKALLAISGDSVAGVYSSFYPDSLYGWGRVNLDTALYFSGNNSRLLLTDNRAGLTTGDVIEYLVNIPAGSTPLKVCLNWTDYPGVANAAKSLVNDLDLDVYNPSGTRYKGNRYNAVVPRQSLANPSAANDSVDVIEGVKVINPAAGNWRIRVTGKNVAAGPQPFALVVTWRTATPSRGTVLLDKGVYGLPAAGVGDTVYVEVHDFNRTDASCNVYLSTKLAEPDSETVVCSRIGNGLYRGKIPLWRGDILNFNGVLTADQQDSIRAVYPDNSPAANDTAKAVVKGVPFTITNVYSGDVTPPVGTRKVIYWSTSENASTKIYYGTTTALGQTAGVDTPLVKGHAFTLTGLTANQTYYFDVESRDMRGNTVRDNNGGRHYMFSTGGGSGQNDILVWIWDDDAYANSFVHGDYLTKALSQGGWTYDWWSAQLQGDVSTTQLKKYKAVFIQVAQDGPQGGNYPAFRTWQRDTLQLYHNAGARFSVTGNDLGWDTWANNSNGKSAAERAADTIFCRNYLHFTYKGDVASSNTTLTDIVYGIASDPISGSYTGGVSHSSWRTGAAGDSIINSQYLSGYTGAAGTGSPVWDFENAFDTCAVKWESQDTMGNLGNGVWGGYRTRTVMNAFEITQLDTANHNSTIRADILNKLFIWLIGHNHPYDTIQTPVAGNTYNTSPISISWRSYADVANGAYLDTTWVEYSANGGNSWTVLTSGHSVASPYSWNISALENGTKYQVRVRVKDGGVYPAMSGFDTVGNFTINRGLAGDFTGPIILPGTVRLSRNPVGNGSGNGFVIQATVSDSTCGLSPVSAAKCSVRIGSTSYVTNLTASDGTFDEIVEDVQGNVASAGWTAGTQKVYIRAADNSAKANRWGAWDSTYVTVTGTISTPLAVELSYFSASVTGQGVVISWRTESEKDSYLWLVERSASAAGPYAEIGSLPASGNSVSPRDYSFTDNSVPQPGAYWYRLIEVALNGDRTVFGPVMIQASDFRPLSFALAPAWPNPFNRRAVIRYQLPQDSRASLKVYNIMGQLVKTLADGVQSAGYYTATWDGTSDQGTKLAAGIYVCKFSAEAVDGSQRFNKVRSLTLIK
jgi:hypothetical protein